ncbi:nucleotidyl transferase AbiEii/AbiGii toxin family protein [Phaeobacter sp. JH20_39]|uniref:nucleotidyl transferase AbiEii/AbiGii toxin family protein n=1 Tax=Phaeobacter sp. JH20_39 TaxID=3112496 RepID=UPI003A84C234
MTPTGKGAITPQAGVAQQRPLDRAQLGFGGDRDPELPDLSGGKRKFLLEELQDAAEATVAGPLLDEVNAVFSASLEQPFSLAIDEDDPQTVLFVYPSLRADSDSYIQPVIRFEFGARGAQLPAEQRPIVTYVQQAFPDLPGLNAVDVRTLGICHCTLINQNLRVGRLFGGFCTLNYNISTGNTLQYSTPLESFQIASARVRSASRFASSPSSDMA